PPALPPARLAARLSQGPILRALAPLEARPVQSCLVALDPGDARRRRATAEDIKPLGGVERADGTGRSSCRRGGGSRRGPAAMSPLRYLPDAVPWRVPSFGRAVTLRGRCAQALTQTPLHRDYASK